MGFHETAIFPTDISYGSKGGPGYSTNVVTLDSGQETRVSRWSQPRHEYDASYGMRTLEDLQGVLEFYHARQGSANGFRYKDPLDFSTDSTRRGTAAWDDVSLGLTDSSDQVQFVSKYTEGGSTRTRNITKPISGTLKVGWGGVEKTETTDWTCDYTTGVISTVSSTTETIYAGGQFHVPCRFGIEVDANLSVSINQYEMGGIQAIPIVEIKDSTPTPMDFWMGGGIQYDLTGGSTVNHSLSDGRVVSASNSSGSSCTVLLGSVVSGMPSGGPYFYIVHTGAGAGSVVVKDLASGGVYSKTLAQGEGTVICIAYNGTNRTWVDMG